jgi:hypothetical protein
MRKIYFVILLLGLYAALFSNRLFAQPAGMEGSPAVFEPGKISDPFPNRDMAISADGNELFYTIQFTKGYFSVIMHCVKENGGWSEPEVASFSGKYSDLEPSFSPDGKKLYFSSSRPLADTGAEKDFDIWFVTKTNGVWQNPQNVGAPVNTAGDEFYASVANSGNIYFTRNTEGRNDDIKMCRYENGRYGQAVSLSDSVNSAGFEFNAYIDPGEQFILYTAYNRPSGQGSGDLYISRKTATGTWGKGVNLAAVNSPYMDYCPYVTADKKYLYFTSDRPLKTTPFKKRLNTKALKAMLNAPGNRFDDIYVVSSKVLAQY